LRWYFLGFALVQLTLTAWAFAHLPSGFDPVPRAKIGTAMFLLVLPVLAAVIGAMTLHVVEPRRHLNRAAGARLVPLAAGAAGAALSIAASLLILAFLSGPVTERVIVALCAFFAARFTVRVLPRAIPGQCGRCGYDLSGATVRSNGRCPECGLDSWESGLGRRPPSTHVHGYS